MNSLKMLIFAATIISFSAFGMSGKFRAIKRCEGLFTRSLIGDVQIRNVDSLKNTLYSRDESTGNLIYVKSHVYKIYVKGLTKLGEISVHYIGKCWASKDGDLANMNNNNEHPSYIEMFKLS